MEHTIGTSHPSGRTVPLRRSASSSDTLLFYLGSSAEYRGFANNFVTAYYQVVSLRGLATEVFSYPSKCWRRENRYREAAQVIDTNFYSKVEQFSFQIWENVEVYIHQTFRSFGKG